MIVILKQEKTKQKQYREGETILSLQFYFKRQASIEFHPKKSLRGLLTSVWDQESIQ